MSLFNIGRRDAVDQPAATSWWRWNSQPGGATPTVAAPLRRDPWWRWSPARRNGRVAADAERAAYVDGVQDQRRTENDVERRAYRQGEADGRRLEARRHRGHPVLAAVVFLIALAGVGYGCLAYEEGSFAAGGAVIDQKIAEMKGDAGQAASRAGVASGQAVQNAGADLSARGQAITERSQALAPPSGQSSGGQSSRGQSSGG